MDNCESTLGENWYQVKVLYFDAAKKSGSRSEIQCIHINKSTIQIQQQSCMIQQKEMIEK